MDRKRSGSGRSSALLFELNQWLDLAAVGFATLLCSLPVLTLGISFAAMYSAVRKIQMDTKTGNIFAVYFTEWRNSVNALGWAGYAFPLALLALAASWYFVFAAQSLALLILILFCTLFVLNLFLYLFILEACFESEIQSMLISAGKLALARFFPGVGALLIQFSPLILLAAAPRLFIVLLPLFAVLGLSAPACWIMRINRTLIDFLSKNGNE